MRAALGRLKTRSEFLRVAGARRKRVSRGFVLQAFERKDDNDTVRVGFTVSRAVGNAVVRNRAKRRLRAAAADVIADTGRSGMDYVLIGRRDTPTVPYDELTGDLRAALKALGPEKGRRQ